MNPIKSPTKFCHYTSMESARKILSDGKIFLNRFSSENDKAEYFLHGDEDNKIFSCCLCNSEAINIPLYYLYGGIDGKGCRIQFTASKLSNMISDCELSYVNKQNNCLKKVIQKDEYEIFYDWIHYIAQDGYCVYRTLESKQYDSLENAIVSLKKDNLHYFIKNPIWKYENEFRIVVRFKHDVNYEKIALKFNIKNNEKGISLMCGPEITDEEFTEIQDEFKDYGINKIEKSSKYEIHMNLVKRNKSLLG